MPRTKAKFAAPRAPRAPRAPLIMALEPRVMFDGAAAPTAHAIHVEHHDGTPGLLAAPRMAAQATTMPLVERTTETSRPDIDGLRATDELRESGALRATTVPATGPAVVFVDSRVVDAAGLLAGVTPGTLIVTLQPNSGGLEQIASYLSHHREVGSVEILAHGSDGDLVLGNTDVTADNVAAFAGTLGEIGHELRPGADILLYACDTAATARGLAFVDALARDTGHVVAASSNVTGAGGDWNLEIATGTVTAVPVLSKASEAHYAYSLGTTTVGTAAQLDAAIAADDLDLTGNDTITLTGNITYAAATDAAVITHAGTGTLTINGAGYTINAAYLSRVLTVTAGNVVLENITLEHGLLAGAGGALSLSGVSELGAGIYNSGTLTLLNVNVTQNVATAGGGGGTGAVGAGGGGGGGAGGIGGAAGGGVGAGAGSGSTGGKGSGTGGGFGGSASGGGAGGMPTVGGSAGGSGATATSASLTVGGGGGGTGYVAGNGAAGGNAAGGIYNAGTGRLYVLGGSTITNNLGAAGGGGGGIGTSLVGGITVPFHGGAGGQGIGGIWNATTGQVYITAAAYSAMTGNVGADGTIGSAGPVSSGGSNAGITTPAAAANINSGSGTVSKTYVPTTPVVSSISTVGGNPNNAASDSFTVSFSEAVTGVNALDFSLTNTGTVAGAITSVTGSGSTYTVVVGPVTGDGTLSLNFNPTTPVYDAAGNAVASSFTSGQAYTIEHTPPVATSITGPSANPNNLATDTFTVNFSEAVGGVAANDFTLLSTGTVMAGITSVTAVNPVNGRSASYTVTVGGPGGVGSVTGDGTLELNLNATGTGITDAAGNAIVGGAVGPVYGIEHTAPVVTSIDTVGSTTNNASSEAFVVTFSEAVSTPLVTDFTLTNTGTSAGVITSITPVTSTAGTGGYSSYTVLVSPATGDGTMRLNFAPLPSPVDAAGNVVAASFTSGETYTIEHTPPVATSITGPANNPNNLATDTFTVNFSEAVGGVAANDFTLLSTGTVMAGITSVTAVNPVNGRSASYTVTVGGPGGVGSVTGDGTLELNLNATGTGISDAAGNAIVGGAVGPVYGIEHTAPVVTSIDTVGSTTNNASSEAFVVTFSEAVSTPLVTDFTLTNTGTSAGVITSITPVTSTAGTGGYSSYTVLVSPATGDGTMRLNFAPLPSPVDAAGNVVAASFTSGETYTIEHTPPVATSIATSGANPNHAGSDSYTVTFSENVSGVVAGDFTLATTGGVTGSITSVTAMNPDASGRANTYTVTVGGVTGNGTLQVNLNGTSTGITDAAGNALVVGTVGQVYVIEQTPPVATSITGPANNPNNLATDTFTVNFSEAVGGVAANDFTLLSTGTVMAGITSVAAVNPVNGRSASYTVTVGGPGGVGSVTGNGTLELNLNATGTGITDAAGNAIVGGAVGPVYGIEHTAPVVTSIDTVGSTTNNASSEAFVVTFSEPVSTPLVTDFSLSTTGSATGAVTSITPVTSTAGTGGYSSYTVLVSPATGDGTMSLNFAPTPSPVDAAGNTVASSYTSGQAYTIEHTAPVATSIVAASGDSPSAQSEQFTVNFSENVGNVVAGDFTLLNTGTVGGAIASVAAVNPDSNGRANAYTVTVNGVTGIGTLQVNLNATGTGISDAAGNAIVGGAVGPVYGVTHTLPTVTSITLVDAATNNLTAEQYTVNFSENVTGVNAADFSLTNTGTAGGVITSVTGSGSTYTVTVSPVVGDGTMRLDLNAVTTIVDGTGNTTAGGYTSGPVYTIEHTPPVATSITGPSANPNNLATDTFTVNFSEAVGGVAANDFTLLSTGTVMAGITSVAAVNPVNGRSASYTVTVGGPGGVGSVTGNGTLELNLNATGTGITDAAGNALVGGAVGPVYGIEHTAPVVTSIDTVGSTTNNASSEAFVVTFSEAVSTPLVTDFSLSTTGSATGAVTSITPVTSTAGTGGYGSYTVLVSPATGDGTLRLNFAPTPSPVDAAGNVVAASFTSGETYTIEHTPPAALSITAAAGDSAASTSDQFTVAFSEPVTGVATTDFTLLAGGGASGTIAAVTPVNPVNGAASTYTVTVGGIHGNGTIEVDLNATGTGITDLAGNPLVGGAVGTPYTVNATAPSVTSITLVDAATNNLTAEQYTVNFSENVTGVNAADFSLTNTGTAGGVITSVTGSGSTYTVTVSPVVGDGTMRLDLNAVTTIVDGTGNTTAGGYTSGPVYTIEHTPPVATSITGPSANPNNLATDTFTVNFSEAVGGVAANDFTLLSTGTVMAGITSVAAVNPVNGRSASYTVTVGGPGGVGSVTGNGTLELNLNATGTGISDAAGNAIVGGAVGPVYGIEHTAPVVTSIDTVGSTTNNASSEAFVVTFSEPVSTPLVTDFSLSTTGSATGAVTSITPVTSTAGTGGYGSYTVLVGAATGDGTMRLNFAPTPPPVDAAGNTVAAGFTTGETYTIEHTPPTVTSVTAVNVGPSDSSTQVFTVDFSEGVTGVTAADFSAATTGTVGTGTITVAPTSPYSNSYTVTVNGVTGNGTLGLNVNSSGTGITDAAGNAIVGGFSTGASIVIQNTPPAVTSIALVDAATNNLASDEFTVTFSEAVGGVTTADFTLTNGGTVAGTIASVVAVNPDVLGHATTYTVTVNNVTGDGTMRLDLSATESGITDYAGNMASGGYTAGPVYTIEHTPPAVTSIALVDPATNNATSEQFTVNFSESVGGVSAGDFTLSNGGTVGGSITSVTAVNPDANGRASAYTVTVGNVTGDGSMKLNLIASESGIEDAAGNAASGGYTTGPTYTIEHTAPVVSSINLVDAPVNNLASEQFTVTFSENVGGVTAGDFILTDSGGVNGTIAAVTAVNPDGTGRATTYTVTVNNVTGNGTMRLDLNAAESGITDAAGNAVSGGYTSGPTYTIEHTPPAVTSIALVDPATNNAASEQFTVNFSENVGGLTAGDFVLTNGGSVSGTIGAITAVSPGTDGRASSYTVTVNGVTGDGTMRLDVSASQSGITDAAGNAASGAYTAGPSYTLEHTAPVVASIGLVDSASNDNPSEAFTVNFSQNVGGVTVGDFVLGTTGTVTGAITAVAAIDPDANGRASAYTVTVTGVSGVGTMRLELGSSTSGVTDAAGNALTGGYDAGPAYTLGTAVPAVESIAVVGPTISNAGSEQFVVQFSEDVTGVGSGDFALTTSGTAAGTIAAVSGSGTTYTVTVAGVSGDGTLRLDLNGTGPGIVDAAGHPLQTGFTSGEVVTLEHTPPVVTAIAAVGPSPNNAATETYTVTFSQNVTGVTAADFSLVNSGSVTGTIAAVTGSGDTYTVTVGSVTGNGTMRLDLNAGAGIVDAAGNPLAGGYTGAVITLEHSAPTVTAFVPVGPSPNHAGSDQYTITFSENVTGVDLGDFTLLQTGTAAGKITAVTGSGDSYTVTVSDVTGDGTLEVALNASAGGISDAAGNTLGGGASGSGSRSEPPTIVEHTPPAVSSIDTVGANPNDAATERFTVTFSQDVSGVTTGDFSLSTTGTASGRITSLSGSGDTYVVTVSNVTGDGTMRLDLNASGTGITDAAGNPIAAGFTAGETFTLQHAAPVVESVSAPPSSTYTAGETFDFTVTFNEPVVVDTAGGQPGIAVNLASGGTHNATYVGGSGTNTLTFQYTVGPTDQSPNGITLGTAINLNGATLADAAGNAALLTLANVASDRGVILGGAPPQVAGTGSGTGSGAGAGAAGGAPTAAYLGFVDTSLYTSNELATARYLPLIAEIEPIGLDRIPGFTDPGTIAIDQSIQPPLAVAALVEPVNSRFAFSVPIGTFQFDPGAVVVVNAGLAGGGALPSWLHFDPSTGRFQGTAPAGWNQHLHIIVSARDQNGRDVMLPVEVQFAQTGGTPRTAPSARLMPRVERDRPATPAGKESLATQFTRYGRHARERELGSLVNRG